MLPMEREQLGSPHPISPRHPGVGFFFSLLDAHAPHPNPDRTGPLTPCAGGRSHEAAGSAQACRYVVAGADLLVGRKAELGPAVGTPPFTAEYTLKARLEVREIRKHDRSGGGVDGHEEVLPMTE
jgi:hypothetical protein